MGCCCPERLAHRLPLCYCLLPQTGVSLRYILDFGSHPLAQQLLMSARFLHGELPVRFAHRIEELTYGLPPELANSIHIRRVKRW